MRRVLLSTSVALTLLTAPLRADRYDDAFAQAQAKLATPEGQAYAVSVAARFDEKKLRDALLDCAEGLPAEDAPPFTVLMEMTADGRPTQVLLRPPAPVAVCLRWVVRESSFPRPPAPGYWVSVDLSATRAAGAPVIPTPGVATATVPPTRTPAAPPPQPKAPPLTPTPSEASISILAQSEGLSPDDPKLEASWARAAELRRPAVIALGPELPGQASPRYRVALGDPLKLESVLLRHPTLRVIVSGAGWPFGDAMAGLMRRYPQVSVDIRPLTQALPDAEVQAYVRRLADAGCGDRIRNSAN